MAERRFVVKYFRGSFNPDPPAYGLHPLLSSIATKACRDRHMEVDGGDIFLAEYTSEQKEVQGCTVFLGEMRRMRIHDRVAEGDAEGNIGDVKLSKNRHINESSFFLVVPKYKTLLYYQSRHGVPWTLFKKYLNYFAPNETHLEILPIPNKALVEKYRSMSHLRKVVLQVAKPDKWNLEEDPSTKEVIRSAGIFGADLLTIELSNGRSRRDLKATGRWIIDKLIGHGKEHPDLLRKLYVEGYENDDGEEKLMIDLLKQNLEDERTYRAADIRTFAEFKTMAYNYLRGSITERIAVVAQAYNEAEAA